MLSFAEIHTLFKAKTSLKFVAAGQNDESLPLPYFSYEILREPKYREYQVLPIDFETSGEFGRRYYNPTKTEVQYTVHFDGKQQAAALSKIRELYRYITTDKFKMAMKRLDFPVNYTLLGDGIRTTNTIRNEFFEKQYSFDIRYIWADVDTDPDVDVIETANTEQIPVAEGQ